ncbi:hypothetical protein ACFL54_01925 [Planctomycetota bacterium]
MSSKNLIHIWVYFGVFLGIILFLLGLRRLLLHARFLKKAGLFRTAVFLTLLFAGSELPLETQRQGCAADEEEPDYDRQYLGTEEFKLVKTLWQKLDAVKPEYYRYYLQPEADPPEKLTPPEMDTPEKCAQWAEEIKQARQALKTMQTNNQITADAAAFIEEIISQRFTFLSEAGQDLFCRMVREPDNKLQDSATANIELRLDALVELRSEGTIDKKVFARGLENIACAFKKYALVNLFMKNRETLWAHILLPGGNKLFAKTENKPDKDYQDKVKQLRKQISEAVQKELLTADEAKSLEKDITSIDASIRSIMKIIAGLEAA